MDVFSILKEEDIAYVNYLMVQNGTIVQTKQYKLETHLDETDEEILSFCRCATAEPLSTAMPKK